MLKAGWAANVGVSLRSVKIYTLCIKSCTQATLSEFLGEPETCDTDVHKLQRTSISSMASVASAASTRSKRIVSAEEKYVV